MVRAKTKLLTREYWIILALTLNVTSYTLLYVDWSVLYERKQN